MAIATVLATSPSLLVLDEPSANLDPRARRELLDVLTSIDRTMLLTTHDLPLAAELCERAVILAGGRIVADGGCHELLADTELLAEYDLELPAGFDLDLVSLRPRPGRGRRRPRPRSPAPLAFPWVVAPGRSRVLAGEGVLLVGRGAPGRDRRSFGRCARSARAILDWWSRRPPKQDATPRSKPGLSGAADLDSARAEVGRILLA